LKSKISADCQKLTKDESDDFISSAETGLPPQLAKAQIATIITQEYGYLIGAVRLSINCIKTRFSKDLAPTRRVLEYYFSHDFTQKLDACYGNQHSVPIRDDLKKFLQRCVSEAHFNSLQLQTESDLKCFKLLESGGVLASNAKNEIRFSSPLARRYW
jgi:hypothetical protein